MKCFYHSADFDGICSGAIVKKRYPMCEMYPINYGEKFPWDSIEPQEQVFMVDFSLQPFEDTLKLADRCILTLIDHHRSVINDFNKHVPDPRTRFKLFGVLKEDKAACESTWEYFYPKTKVPRVVTLLGRYDIWDHEDPDVLPFQYGMRAVHQMYLKPGSIWWNKLFQGEYIDRRIKEGKTIMKYEGSVNTRIMELFSFEGLFPWNNNLFVTLYLNRGGVNSKTFKSHYIPDRHELMVSFVRIPGGKWTVSLYTTHEHIDCGKIAKSLGGGGHPKAAGFQTDSLWFLEI